MDGSHHLQVCSFLGTANHQAKGRQETDAEFEVQRDPDKILTSRRDECVYSKFKYVTIKLYKFSSLVRRATQVAKWLGLCIIQDSC